MDTRRTFAYRPLTEPDAIRLLVLEPAPDDRDALRGTLLHTILALCDYELIEPYTTLSYVWGPSAETGTIYLSGHAVTITATLASALCRLRDETRPRRIWADALCIDQSTIPERSQQVTLMGIIYGVATHTVIYLGPSTPEFDLVLRSAPRASSGHILLWIKPHETLSCRPPSRASSPDHGSVVYGSSKS
ncbi:hypothetical protein NKR19_g8389 [Coniochaeta hoffmannii]|uniref:Heterokaryon incompatibility domain-containing protein n=1 Tax=Coniochaeta hoffmannii TaxID=91930 RepID=A0AA38RFN2_9PEZI|nr:hypothetical protein NKR19_g8389 [Coniochaeta hoffmannii]